MFLRIIVELLGLLLLVQGQAEHRLGVDGQVRAVAVEEVAHVGRCRRRRRPAPCRRGRRGCRHVPSTASVLARRRSCSSCDLLGLVVLAASRRRVRACRAADATSFCLASCRPWTTTAVVCGQECSPQPENQPQPPSESCMLGQALARRPATIVRTSSSSKTGLRSIALPALGALAGRRRSPGR